MKAIFLSGIAMMGAIMPLSMAQQAVSAPPKASSAAPAPRFEAPNQEQARQIADRVYNTWRVSMMRGNETAWRSSTTSARQMKVRNLLVSQKKSFPRDFFKGHPTPPPLEQFVYVGALASSSFRTMAATYLGNVQLGDSGKPEPSAFVLEFVYEDGRWCFDQSRMFNLSRLPKVVNRLRARDVNVLMEQDGFHPYPEPPKVPARCPYPALIGKVFVDAPGRVIEMNINGVSTHSFADERRADVISGGLKKGLNTITYTIETEPGKPHPSMAIGVFVMPEASGHKPVCSFDHILDAKDVAKGGKFSFFVSDEMLASMNPAYNGKTPQPFHAVPLKQKPQKK